MLEMAGVRIIGGRIYDSENGKTCHQCRQKTRDFVASCKHMKKDKQCTISFCHKCLLNRYGEKAEEVELLESWTCPKCRGVCNCSFCRKKQGLKPTGLLAYTAKEGGFGSVSEMLTVKGPENFGIERKVLDKENAADGNGDAKVTGEGEVKKVKKRKRLKEISNGGIDDSKISEDVSVKKAKSKKRKNKDRSEDADDRKLDGEDVQTVVNNNNVVSIKEVKPRKKKCKERNDEAGDAQTVVDKNDVVSVKEAKPRKKKSKERNKEADDRKREGDEVQAVVDNNDVRDKGKQKCKDKVKVKASKKTCLGEEYTANILNKEVEPELPLPQGIPLTSVLGIELPPEDAGNALQFLEFCSAFGQVLNIKKAEAESILGELLRQRSARNGRPGQYSSVIRFHVQLLSLLQEDMGEELTSIDQISQKKSWFKDLGKCISDSESKDLLKELPTDCFSKGGARYDSLDLSQKLRLMTYLCDEVICTSKLRSWIEEQHEKVQESKKEAKRKVNAAKEKEKLHRQKLQDEVAKLIIAKNGAPLSISEHEVLVSQIKSDAAQAHAELLEAEGIVSEEKQRFAFVRTEPYLVDDDGCIFWKLKSYNNGEDLVLQDMGVRDAVAPKEEWFVYGAETKEEIDKYCSFMRRKKLRSRTVSEIPTVPRESDEDNM